MWYESTTLTHDDVIKWKYFPLYWPFVRGIHRSSVNSAHKGQWRGALMYPLICLNTLLSKQSWGWWFETPSRSLWRHRNETLLEQKVSMANRMNRKLLDCQNLKCCESLKGLKTRSTSQQTNQLTLSILSLHLLNRKKMLVIWRPSQIHQGRMAG